MGQIIQLHLGQAGTRVGSQFISSLINQHNIDYRGQTINQNNRNLGKVDVFFKQQQNKNAYRTRTVIADMTTDIMEDMIRSPLVDIYRFENICYHTCGTRNIWSTGYFRGEQISHDIMDSIRRQVQLCDHLAGFITINSICGGTGSGLGSLLLQSVDQQYEKQTVLPVLINPSLSLSNITVQLYNAMLYFQTLNNDTNQPCLLFDNQALFANASDYTQINKRIANGLCNLTSPIRFSCDGNVSLRKMYTNLIQYPYYRYLNMGMPYSGLSKQQKFLEIIKYKMYSYKNYSLKIQESQYLKQKWLTSYFIFRGNIWSTFDVNYKISEQLKRKHYKRYSFKQFKEQFCCRSLPHNYMACCVDTGESGQINSVTSIHSNTMIKQIMRSMHEKISVMIRRKAYLHYYNGQGTQNQQMYQALTNLMDIMHNYESVTQVEGCGGEYWQNDSDGSDCN